jgi:hypothetical protein
LGFSVGSMGTPAAFQRARAAFMTFTLNRKWLTVAPDVG